MFNWYEVQAELEIAQERYQPLREANQLQRALAQRPNGTSRLDQFLTGTGQRLIDWGRALQQRAQHASSQELVCCA